MKAVVQLKKIALLSLCSLLGSFAWAVTPEQDGLTDSLERGMPSDRALPAVGAVGALTAPSAPLYPEATAGNAAARIAFATPATDGGSSITGYTATCRVAAISKTGNAMSSPVTISGLSNGTSYTCSVSAKNAQGVGAPSVSVTVTPSLTAQPSRAFTMTQTLSDGAQRTTLAFAALAMATGNLEGQSFFPPGKVADYTGFQYLRDNDPDNMGHNTSFLTRVAYNVIYVLNDSQMASLKSLAVAQLDQINLYGYKRYPLLKAFRRQLEGDLPAGSSGLNLNAMKKASRDLYLLDGQISFDRAVLYANIFKSLDASQKAHLDAMKGKGWNSWPNISDAQIQSKMKGLPQGTAVAVMTYASDMYSWYAGAVDADVYFCPERHGTYFGSFYIKDAPAIGHEGYSIDEQLTATAGSALSDSAKGYVTQSQASLMSSLVATQRNNLYASPAANIVKIRTEIAILLRSLLIPSTSATAVKTKVLELSGLYGDLDGENNHAYAIVFAQVFKTLTTSQTTKLAALRKSIMSGTYANGTPFDYSIGTTFFLYSEPIVNASLLAPYTANTHYLFFEPAKKPLMPALNLLLN
jgi:hypothetical protein